MVNTKKLTFELYMNETLVFDSMPDGGADVYGLKAIFKNQSGVSYFVLPEDFIPVLKAATTFLSKEDVDFTSLAQCMGLLRVSSMFIEKLGSNRNAQSIRFHADDVAKRSEAWMQKLM